MPAPVIEAVGLRKQYGAHRAVDGVDLEVAGGHVLGLLGPNGAGKSTTVRMLTTMTVPDGGSARVMGRDVVHAAREVRQMIGVTGQDASVDEVLTGRQNLVLIGELAGLRRRTAVARARELLAQFELADAADRVVKGYSGGMRRRLDLAASLVNRPPVLFLDEPTTGLDPTSRLRMWDIIRGLVADGTTLLLTTQYLDEADQLADDIAVIDHGRVIAAGAPHDLKRTVGGEQLDIVISAPDPKAAGTLAALVPGDVTVTDDGRHLRAAVTMRPGIATDIVRAFDAAGIAVDDITLHRPSLDDVFFALTGAASVGATAGTDDRMAVPA